MADMIRTVLVEQKMMYEERIAQLTRERDEARRIACENEARHNGMMFDNSKYSDAVAIAEERGWDCFKENTND